MRVQRYVVACLAGLLFAASLNAATVWTGPPTTFLKTGAEPTTVQDVLTPNVSLTRGAQSILFNPLGGDLGPNPGVTPSDTEWAFAGLGGNPLGPAFSAANFAALAFSDFLTSLGGPGPAGGGGPGIGNVILNQPGVLHLITDDIYIDIQFLQWGTAVVLGGTATVEYQRASVPVPPALPLLASALGFIAWRRRHAESTRSGK